MQALPALSGPGRAGHGGAQGRHLRPGGEKRRGENHSHPGGVRPAGPHGGELLPVRGDTGRGQTEPCPAAHGRGGGDALPVPGHDGGAKPQAAIPGAGAAGRRGHPGAFGAGGALEHRQEKGRALLFGDEAAAGHCHRPVRGPGLSCAGRAHQRPGPPGHCGDAGADFKAEPGAANHRADFLPHSGRAFQAGHPLRVYRRRADGEGGQRPGAGGRLPQVRPGRGDQRPRLVQGAGRLAAGIQRGGRRRGGHLRGAEHHRPGGRAAQRGLQPALGEGAGREPGELLHQPGGR